MFVFRSLTLGEIGCFLSHYFIWEDVSVFNSLIKCILSFLEISEYFFEFFFFFRKTVL